MRLLPITLSLSGALLLAVPATAQRPTARQAPKAPAEKSGPATKPVIRQIAPPLPTTGFLQGVAVDSIHGGPLIGALIQLEGTDRAAITDTLGRFLVDSIKPGSYKIAVDHPILDTLGIMLSTEPVIIAVNEVTRFVVAIPTGEFLASRFCTPARRTLGPSVLVGRVREPDSENAAIGARVSLVWYDPDPPDVAGIPIKVKKAPRVREATVGPDGTYRLCGLPEKFEGKLMAQRKDGGTTAEVAIAQEEGVLSLRSMSVAPLAVASGSDTSAASRARGSARVTGRVTNNAGAPVAGARVGLMGSSASTRTKSNGEFILDSLPAGTQSLEVRQLGYAPTEVPVELSARNPARKDVKMGAYVPELAPVEVVSQRDQGLERVGFTTRKRSGASGYFITPEQIEARKAIQFTDLMTTVPGMRVQGSMGRMSISSTRMAGRAGCVTIIVDGSKWQQLEAGDLDSFLKPDEVAAIEVYQSGTAMPVEYTTTGQDCSAVVVWTKQNVNRRTRKK
ncbi:MAG: carboxypeptidase regulatory-like domain-containing protein [Gemmatimonadaceae bacterium]